MAHSAPPSVGAPNVGGLRSANTLPTHPNHAGRPVSSAGLKTSHGDRSEFKSRSAQRRWSAGNVETTGLRSKATASDHRLVRLCRAVQYPCACLKMGNVWKSTMMSQAPHVSAMAVHCSSHFAVTTLFTRLVKLWLNETGLWPDSSVDRQAEAAFLSTSLVPVAIVAMKSDLADKDDGVSSDSDSLLRGVAHIQLHKHSVTRDAHLRAFLKRAAEAARRRTASNKQLSQPHSSGQVMLGFI